MEKGIQVLQEQGIDVFQLINDNNLGDSAAKVTQAIINLQGGLLMKKIFLINV